MSQQNTLDQKLRKQQLENWIIEMRETGYYREDPELYEFLMRRLMVLLAEINRNKPRGR